MQNEEEENLAPTQTSERIAALPLRRIILARGTINVSTIRALGTFCICYLIWICLSRVNTEGSSFFMK